MGIVAGMSSDDREHAEERDEPIKIDLDPEEALKALLKVDPEAEPVEDDPAPPHGDPLHE
jgi:hypothetical protein